MTKIKLNKINQKLIGQILFRPSLDSFCNAPLIAKVLEKKFKEWQVEGDNITLYSPEDFKLMQIFYDKITYLNEGEENFDELYQYIKKIHQQIITHSVDEIRRIGVRNTIIFESPFEFSELVEHLFKKLFPQNEDFLAISGGKTKDVAFILDSERNGFLNHIKIGPVNKQEAPKYYNSNFDRALEIEKSGNIFVDIDVYITSNLTKDNSLEKLKMAIVESKSIADDYLRYITA